MAQKTGTNSREDSSLKKIVKAHLGILRNFTETVAGVRASRAITHRGIKTWTTTVTVPVSSHS